MSSKQNLWIQKKKKIILLIAAVMAVVLVVSFISFFKIEEENKEEEFKPYESMYNASRYFFRVFYPDDWDVSADPYGFFMDEEGLVLELFPLKKITSSPSATGSVSTNTPSPAVSESTSSATADPRAGMERNPDLTLKIYYKEYADIADKIAASKNSGTENAAVATGTAVTDKHSAPVSLADLSEYLFDNFKKSHENAELEKTEYKYAEAKMHKGNSVEYCILPYTYIQNDIKMSGEMYVASRAMAYYVIFVEGTNSAFTRYNSVVGNIMHNLKFSVFDY